GRRPTTDENRQLAQALQLYQRRTDSDDFSALERFIGSNPASPWRASVWFNLASEYYNTGWYSKSLSAWEQVWPLLKDASDPGARALGDRAAGELAYMYGRLGRLPRLAALLDSVQNRVFVGSATEKIAGAKQGLWTMQHWPEAGFRCGPFALG